MTTSAEQQQAAPAEPPAMKRLEEEGEIAADYLEELLDIADLDGDIDIDIDHGRAAVEIVAEEGSEKALARLVGAEGEVLDALQELTRLAVQAKTGDRSRLMLDVAGFRARRRAELLAVASEAIESVRTSGTQLALEPMNPFERKVVHDAVAAAGFTSDSDGVEPNRYVVIRPA
jgi:spoIIIJ-associated protein